MIRARSGLPATSETTSPERVSSASSREIRQDWVVIAAAFWLGAGLYWDGWAHGYGLPDSFWTIWHAAFYSGFGACAVAIAAPVILARSRTAPWRDIAAWRAAIPAGYERAVLGVLIFSVGGVIDMTWHTLFGIEFSTDALLSPSHMILAVGAALIASGPFLAATRRQARGGLVASLPAVISLTFLLGAMTFFTLFAGPYSGIIGAGSRPADATLVRALLGVYLFSALIVGVALVALRRGLLPFGALTVILGLNAFGMILMRGHALIQAQVTFMVVAIVAGVIGDLLVRQLRPSMERVVQLRLFAIAFPALYWALYLAVAVIGFGSGWTVHELTGIVVQAGIVGFLVSYVFVGDGR
ncbi:MAG TPA: hypothetical protein VK197_07605 [Verrucomicrobiae bacterium]|nr:hypothetical protein [Verrucomicrobiae bacterium]